MWQRLAVQSIRGSDEDAPSVAEERAVAGISAGARREIGNDHDVEFETLGLMHAEETDNLVFLTDDLGLGFPNARVLRAVAQVADDVVEGGGSLAREPTSDFDQLADVGDTLAAVLL